MSDTRPIGIFDSGIGGLTVANAVIGRLPNENILYFGDTAHLPYGEKSPEAIRQYVLKIADFLISENCKLVLIACNTASAAGYDVLKAHVSVPVLNVIDPVVDELVADNSISKVGIIGTKATIRSGVYEAKIHTHKPNLEVVSLATGLLASMIENGFFNNSVSKAVVDNYLSYPDFSDIDAMILACTHYPLIKKDIAAYYNGRIKIFDSTDTVALLVEDTLKAKGLLNLHNAAPSYNFYVSDYTDTFEQTARLFFGHKLSLKYYPLWKTEEPVI